MEKRKTQDIIDDWTETIDSLRGGLEHLEMLRDELKDRLPKKKEDRELTMIHCESSSGGMGF